MFQDLIKNGILYIDIIKTSYICDYSVFHTSTFLTILLHKF